MPKFFKASLHVHNHKGNMATAYNSNKGKLAAQAA